MMHLIFQKTDAGNLQQKLMDKIGLGSTVPVQKIIATTDRYLTRIWERQVLVILVVGMKMNRIRNKKLRMLPPKQFL